jgi:hypothetical protein
MDDHIQDKLINQKFNSLNLPKRYLIYKITNGSPGLRLIFEQDGGNAQGYRVLS